MKSSAISSQFLLTESSSFAYQIAATPDRVQPNRESFCNLERPIGLSMSENKPKCTIGSPDLSKQSICGILNQSGRVTAESVYPSSISGMDFTPWDFLNNFSSLLNFNAVGSVSNSKGESGRLVGVLDNWGWIWGRIGGRGGPVGMSVSF